MNSIAIIGAGPTGLTMAHYILKYSPKTKITIFDRECEIGGCHRVRREDDLFTEHGPRIYNSNYVNFKRILNELNLDFNDYFVKYNFKITEIAGKSIKNLSIRELFLLSVQFFNLSFSDSSKKITVLDFCINNNFSSESIDYLDRLCRLTDGAGADRYTLFELLQLPNQHAFYTVFQPNKPNDSEDSWLMIWKRHLESKNVKFVLNTKIENIEELKDYDKLFFCIPPYNFKDILKSPEYTIFAENTNYINYIPITFHYNKKINVKTEQGFIKNDWGVIWIILSDYFGGNLLISSAITRPNTVSKFTGKTANESSRDELINETFRQLNLDVPKYDKAIISSGVFYEDGYKTLDNAFVLTPFGGISSKINDRIYSVGPHNLNSFNSFTSLESAVQNAIFLIHELFPESKNEIPLLKVYKLLDSIAFLLILIFVIIILKMNKFI